MSSFSGSTKGIMTVLLIFVIIIVTNEMVYANRYYYFERPKLGADFSFEYESEDERDAHNKDTEDTEYSFKESLKIATLGWLYHPALIKFNFEIEPGWKRVIRKTDSADKITRDTFLQSYSLDMTILEKKPYTLGLFTRMNYSTLKSSQAHTSETETGTYGASLSLKYKLLPTILNYTHSSSIQTGVFRYEEERDHFSLFARHKNKKSHTYFKTYYQLRERISEDNTRLETDNSGSSILNTYKIGGDDSILLNSSFFHRWTERNSVSSNHYSIRESLGWKHRKNLQSTYNTSFSKSQAGDFANDIITAGAGLSHLLYENLTTALNLNASTNNFTGGSTDDYRGGINFNYKRRIPWGMINLNNGHSYGITRNERATNNLQIINEHRVMSTADITLLDRENIDTGSIVVTDITGGTTYSNNGDYNIGVTGTYTWISLTASSNISDPEEVIVSYSYLANPAYDFSTYTQSYGASLFLWSILNTYYSSSESKQKLLSGIEPSEPQNRKQERMGAVISYKWRFTKTKLLYEKINSTISPRSRALAEETITLRPAAGLFINPSAAYSLVEFRDTNEKEETFRIMAALRWRLTRRFFFTLEGFWNNVSGRSESKRTGFSPGLFWSYGIWQARINYKFSNEESGNTDRSLENHYLKFELKRELF